MKKLGYSLSLAGHALLLLAILNARFPVTIRPGPPRVVVVSIAEPPLPLLPGGVPARSRAGSTAGPGASGAGPGSGTGPSAGAGAGPSASRSALSFPAMGRLSLSSSPSGTFRLAPVGKSPEPWEVPFGPAPAPRPLRYGANAYRPAAAPGGSGGIFLLPFAIGEKAVADWTETVISRIERNWAIPASGRLAFSGRVQITLVIERQGGQRSLVIDDSDLPEPLILAALHAVKASLPFPPLPGNVAGETLAFTFVFAYNG